MAWQSGITAKPLDLAKKSKKSKQKRIPILGFVAFGLLCLALAYGGWHIFQNRYAIRGIDVSRYQGEIEWEKLDQSEVSFAFVKATEGTTLVDPKYVANRKGAKAAKIPMGAYHFFLPAISGKAQAQHFLKHYKPEKGDLPPVLDLEETNDQSAAKIRTEALIWLQTVEKAIGRKPIVYTLPHFASSYLDSKLSEYPLWVVDLNWFTPSESLGWKSWTFWQYKHTGRLDGIVGDQKTDDDI